MKINSKILVSGEKCAVLTICSKLVSQTGPKVVIITTVCNYYNMLSNRKRIGMKIIFIPILCNNYCKWTLR